MAKKKSKGSKAKSRKVSRKPKTAKKKSPKKKAVKKKTAKKKRPARKKTAKKKPAKKAKVKPKKAVKKKRVVRANRSAKVAKPPRLRSAVSAAAPATYIPAPNEMAVGRVTHYYSNLQVAVVELDRGPLQVGDKIHVKGHTTDFEQVVDSMEVEHQRVDRAEPGEIFGLKVSDHAREHDVIYKLQS
jgi:hypothetical protein